MDDDGSRPRPNLRRSGPWIGLTGLVPLLFCYLASARFATWWVVVGLVLVWVGLLVLALRWCRVRPIVVLALPFLGLGLWPVLLWLAAAAG